MNTLLWVVGEPGAGKTTLVRKLFGTESICVPKPKWTVTAGAFGLTAAAGHYRGDTFDGADTVPYNGVNEALDYWLESYSTHFQLTIFDGDRFSNVGVKEYITNGTKVQLRFCCILLSGGPEIAARRRARSEQNETWVKGRITKARNFFETFPDRVEVQGSEDTMYAAALQLLQGMPLNCTVGAENAQKSFF